MYPNDFTKRYHAVSYAFDEDALYLSVGLLNTSYREEYCLWVNSENVMNWNMETECNVSSGRRRYDMEVYRNI